MKCLALTLMILIIFPVARAKEPANKPVGLAAYTLGQPSFEWSTRSSEHFRVHYLPSSVAERQIDSLVKRNEAFVKSDLAILGVKEYDRVIDLFYFDSRNQIGDIVTRPFRALADAENMTVLAVRNDTDIARDAHEIMHVVSYDLWGGWERRTELAWLAEGMATYADEPCNGYGMSELAAHILQNTDEAPPLDSLAISFRDYPEMIGYMLMASFVEFVVAKYGLEYLHRLWQTGYGGIEEVFGKDTGAMEREWHEYLIAEYPNPKVPDWPELKEHGCK